MWHCGISVAFCGNGKDSQEGVVALWHFIYIMWHLYK
nr:MAG TPA: hypothetical protein [Caudoviricetes sp.]